MQQIRWEISYEVKANNELQFQRGRSVSILSNRHVIAIKKTQQTYNCKAPGSPPQVALVREAYIVVCKTISICATMKL